MRKYSARASDEADPQPSLQSISRESLKDTVVRRICQAIEDGELRAGQSLTELGLAKQLHVAQPTIREALLELEFIGFVERTAPRKTRVTLLTRTAIRNIYKVRTRLELLAAETVASQVSPNLVSCWEQVAEMEAAATMENLTRFWRADLNFHRALWRAAQNESLESSLERLVPKLFSFGIIQHAHPNSAALLEMTKLHRHLLEILPEGNEQAVLNAMELLMEKAWLDDAQLPELD